MKYILDTVKLARELADMPQGTFVTHIGCSIVPLVNGNDQLIPSWLTKMPSEPKGKGKGTQGYSRQFEVFWRQYPSRQGVKSGKQEAWKAWQKALKGFVVSSQALAQGSWLPEDVFLRVCLNALEWQRQSQQWKEAEGKYIPMAATWLNQRRFEDERPVEEKKEEVLF